MRILIRADGGTPIGMGHIMRSTVLADSLKRFAEITYVCRSEEEYRPGIEYVSGKGYKVIEIKDEGSAEELKEIKADCLITDSYKVDENYFNYTKTLFNTTGYIDDLNLHRFNLDFILNQNVYAQDLNYEANADTRLFLGPGYALLRKEFRDIRCRELKEQIEDLLLTMGGADPENFTGKILQELTRTLSDIRIHVIVGGAFRHKNDLEKYSGENILFHYNPKMSDLMLKCDAAVSACGSTLYELAVCGIPTIGVVVADNQNMAARKFKALGAMVLAEGSEDILEQIRNLSLEKRKSITDAGRCLVSRDGADKLAREICRLISERGSDGNE